MALSLNNSNARLPKRKFDSNSSDQGPNLFQQLNRKVEESKRNLLHFETTQNKTLDWKSKMTSINETLSSIQKLVNEQDKIIKKAYAALVILGDTEEYEEGDIEVEDRGNSVDAETESTMMTIDEMADYFLVCIKIESCRRFYNPYNRLKNKGIKKQKTVTDEYQCAVFDTSGDFQNLGMIEYRLIRILNHECKKRQGKAEAAGILSVNLIYDRLYKNTSQDNQQANWETLDIIKVWDRIRQFSTSGLDEQRAMKQDLEKGATEFMKETQAFIDSIEVCNLMSFLPSDQFVVSQSDSHRKVPDSCVVCGAKSDGDKVYCDDDCLVKDLNASTASSCEENIIS